MSSRQLVNKPLIEAILEIKWKLAEVTRGIRVDPHYRLLPGRMSERLQKEYPVHQLLGTAQMPEELSAYSVQHQFRQHKDGWPLVQIGPGIATLNDTDSYNWPDFFARARSLFSYLREGYPTEEGPEINQLSLRYIDAVEFDFDNEDMNEFMSGNLKYSYSLPDILFQETGVAKRPRHFQSQHAFESKRPAGRIQLRFSNAQKNGKKVIIWETTVTSAGDDLPRMPEGFEPWLNEAHTLANDWFFKMIDGNLHRRFSGE